MTGEDFLIWQQQFGRGEIATGGAASNSVPEANSLKMGLCLGVASAVCSSRRRRLPSHRAAVRGLAAG